MLFGLLFSVFFSLVKPGTLSDDAGQYEKLSQSILVGQYTIDGAPSMFREPGYPLFRAMVKIFSKDLNSILILQSFLYSFSVLLIGLAFYRMENDLGAPAAWGAALCYGAVFYSSRHLFEILAIFIVSLIAYSFSDWINRLRHWYQPVLLGLLCGVLLLTRYSFLLLPIAVSISIAVVLFQNRKKLIISIASGALCFVIAFSIAFPWMFRNQKIFGTFSMASRSGIILYARGLKAAEPWERYFSTFGSIVFGKALLTENIPNANPLYRDYWERTWSYFNKLKSEGLSEQEIDELMGKEGRQLIFESPQNLFRYVLWSGLDLMRFFAWSSPSNLGSDIEYTFAEHALNEGALTYKQNALLVVLHFVQIIWWTSLVYSVYFGFKRFKWNFTPGILIIAYTLPHLFTDNIVRYSVPILPLVWGSVASFVYFRLWKNDAQKATIL